MVNPFLFLGLSLQRQPGLFDENLENFQRAQRVVKVD